MRFSPLRAASTALLILAGLALYVLRLDHVAGVIGDDAWYMVLAKSIAQGTGPRLISSGATQFVSSVYPPGFPAILSLVFLISPRFPDNLMLLKGVSILGMLGAGALTYVFARRVRGFSYPISLAIGIVTVVTPALVFLATSTLMSEPVFLFVQLLAVLFIERAARATDDRSGRGAAVLAGVLAAAAFLTRMAGMTVGAAGLLYFLWRRRWQQAIAFGAATAVCVLPWLVYAHLHAPTQQQLVDQGGLMAAPYSAQFWTTEAGTVTSRRAGLAQIPARVERNIVNIAIRDMGGIFVPIVFRTPGESGLETVALGPPEGGRVPSMGSALGTKVISAALTALALLGFFIACRQRLSVAEPMVVLALAMIVLWPFWTFRFVLPLVPFLLGYFVLGLETVAGLVGRVSRLPLAAEPVARMFLLVLIGLNVLDHVQYIAVAYDNPAGAPWKEHAANIDRMLDWIGRHAPPGAIVAADNPALVYLHTGRLTIATNSFEDRWTRWRRLNVRYVMSLGDTEVMTEAGAVLRYKLLDEDLWTFELTPSR